MIDVSKFHLKSWYLFTIFALVTVAVYWPGLSGGWIFDDGPNILDNKAVQPTHWTISALLDAALSSPASQFKRPVASLSFAFNHLMGGINPWGWKLTNLVIHLLNGLLVYWLLRIVFSQLEEAKKQGLGGVKQERLRVIDNDALAALIAGAWLLLPINLTGVLYVVQRMESLANLFILLGLLGYVAARQRMLTGKPSLLLCIISLGVPTLVGFGVKETAIMLPLYAFVIEWLVFGFRKQWSLPGKVKDRWLLMMFGLILVLPLIAGLMWLLPSILNPETWKWRDFTLSTRLLSEARALVSYITWIFLPLPHWLSFYHDDFIVSSGLWQPWTTFTSILFLLGLLVIAWIQYQRRPMLALGIALYMAGHLMTATILPLELVFEHRNYFASVGVLIAVLPLLLEVGLLQKIRLLLIGLLLFGWVIATAFTAYQWGSPVRLAVDLATRAPNSPRALYDYGTTLIRLSEYDAKSPLVSLAKESLEQAAALPNASALPYQALIMLANRTGQPVKDEWWNGLINRLRKHRPTSQDYSALAGMTRCAVDNVCQFEDYKIISAYEAALNHLGPSSNLLAAYADYLWNVNGDKKYAMLLIERAIKISPKDPVHRITLAKMAVVLEEPKIINQQIEFLEMLNFRGRLDDEILFLMNYKKYLSDED